MPRRAGRSTTPVEIRMVDRRGVQAMPDELATEEPLEIRLRVASGEERTVAVTMRTPGADAELAAGFLFTEGVVTGRQDVLRVVPLAGEGPVRARAVRVDLAAGVEPDLAPLERHFHTGSACGVCGKAGLDGLFLRRSPRLRPGPALTPEALYELPARLGAAQGVFHATGGLHAAALFDARGALLAVREDVGRHNALDKLVGWSFLEGRLPLSEHVVMVSGRASFEIVQKCLMAEAPVLCAVSAPSSLAVSLAREHGLTLIGFLRGERLNVYSGFERVTGVG